MICSLALLLPSASYGYAPHAARAPSAAHGALAAARASAPVCAEGNGELAVLKQLQDSFWAQKRARMKADMEARLREIEEFEAREAALAEAAASSGLFAPAAGEDVAALQEELAAERAMRLALEQELAEVRAQAELNLQKTAAFWIEKAKKDSASAPAPAAAAAAAPAAAAPSEDLEVVPGEKILTSDLSLTELRSRLLSYGLSTIGLKAELTERLEKAMEHDRLKFKSWDSDKKVWI